MEDKRTVLQIQWLGIKLLVLPKEINSSEISTKTQRDDLGTDSSQLLSRTMQFLILLTFSCQKSSLGFKHFICFTVKSQFPLGDKVNQGKADKFRASSPCRQQIYSQHSSDVVHGGFKPRLYTRSPEVKEYFLPVFKGVYFQAPSFGKCLIWQAKTVIAVQRAENEANCLHIFGWKCYTR